MSDQVQTKTNATRVVVNTFQLANLDTVTIEVRAQRTGTLVERISDVPVSKMVDTRNKLVERLCEEFDEVRATALPNIVKFGTLPRTALDRCVDCGVVGALICDECLEKRR